jgi:hypothetical protein
MARRPKIQLLAALSGWSQTVTVELPYLDWLKVHAAIEKETGMEHDVGGIVDPLVTRGCWFWAHGVRVRSIG